MVSQIVIHPDSIPFLEETARVFRETETVNDSEVLGTVNKLEHQDGNQGKVTIVGSADGIPRTITMELSGVDHQSAIRSYEANSNHMRWRISARRQVLGSQKSA